MLEYRKCKNSREKGDMVGEIVHRYIKNAAQETRDGSRMIFMLAGLSAIYLEGIARRLPSIIENKKLILRINREVSEHLDVKEDLLSDESSTHWRHYDDADIIVFAPPDIEKDNIGASLGPISIIDETRIVNEIEGWVSLLEASELQSSYLEAALSGLRDSKVYIDLDRWTNFIFLIKKQGFSDPVDRRIYKAAPALHIPIFGITNLPKYEREKTPSKKKFCNAFKTAKDHVGVYVGLFTPKNERVVIEEVQEAINDFRSRLEEGKDQNLIDSIDYVQNLIDVSNEIRPGTWHSAQQEFCEKVHWGEVGSKIFTGSRRLVRTDLGGQTLDYLRGNFKDEIAIEEEDYLVAMSQRYFEPDREFEAQFFEKWKERLYNAPSIRLYKLWQGRVFRKEATGQELLTLLLDGFEALTNTGFEVFESIEDPCILVRSSHPNKADYWESKDCEVLSLFQFELGSVIRQLKNRVEFDLLDCFEINSKKRTYTKDGRTIELEMYLIDRSDLSDHQNLKDNLSSAPKIKATWIPGREIKLEPINLSLVDDIAELHRARSHDLGYFINKKITPVEGSFSPITLQDRNTFDDVINSRTGRVFEITQEEKEDLVKSIRRELDKNLKDQLVQDSIVENINSKLDHFLKSYSLALKDISLKPEAGEGFGSPAIIEQANAFGEFCKACRDLNLENNLKRKIQTFVAGIGIVFSSEKTAIITPWHPFRLAEKRAKILALSDFLDGILSSSQKSDISMEFGDLRKKLSEWIFPEIAFHEGNTLVVVESLGGYSLLAPADCEDRSKEALEIAAKEAANYFARAVKQYLDIHPHEASNLSISIYNSESETLPGKISELLASQFHSDPDLRCDLIISHFDQNRLQEIFKNQNSILSTGEIGDNVKAILTRLRVDVRSHNQNSNSEVRDLDLLFLYENISKLSQSSWDFAPSGTYKINKHFDLSNVDTPRRMITEDGINNSVFYHTCPQPPEAITEYHGMLYELAKGVNLTEGKYAYFFSRINGDGTEVKQLIKDAHNLADWVVTYDKSISRKVLEQSNVKIIQDITTPDTDGRVIISASKIEEELEDNLQLKITNTCQISAEESRQIANYVMDDVMSIAGQKLLSAIRHDNAISEILGLSLLKTMLDASLPKKTYPTIWISLDDFRSWITSGKGKIADLLGITINKEEDRFQVYIQVGEAKFISKYSLTSEEKDAKKQVENTLDHIKRSFIDNENSINLKSWCTRLEKLILSQEYQFSRVGGYQFRSEFLESLRNGGVDFHVCGDTVLCLHDDDEVYRLETDKTKSFLRSHVLSRYKIKSILQKIVEGEPPKDDELNKIKWYSREGIKSKEESNVEQEDIGDESDRESLEIEKTPDPIPPPEPLPPPIVQGPAENDAPPKVESMPHSLRDVLHELSKTSQEDFKDQKSVDWAESICTQTQKALSDFGITAKFDDDRNKFRLTPNGVLITFKGNYTLTLRSAESKKSELLTTYGLDVADILPSSAKVTFFIKREKRALVPLANTLLRFLSDAPDSRFFNLLIGSLEDEDKNLPLNLDGKFIGFEEHAPHTLIAGETGSGKGVLIQNLILQLIAFNHPQNVDLYLIDPKMGVDFFWVEDAPHLKAPIMTDPQEAMNLFTFLVQTMDERYRKMRDLRVNYFEDYNSKVDLSDRMPRIVLIHDEIGSWMAENEDYRKVVQSTASHLGMKARAAGINLILITQRPDKDAVPPKLRENLGNRLCLRVNSKSGSKIVLDCEGAEKLLGKGHIACKFTNQNPPSGRDFFVAQVPFADQNQIRQISQTAIEFWKNNLPNYNPWIK